MLMPIFATHTTERRIRTRRSWHASSRICVFRRFRLAFVRSPATRPAPERTALPTKIFWARDIVGRTDWIDEAIDSLTENVYLTIDIDGLDPSIVPTTGTPEPGGLGWYETLTLIRKLAEKKRVVGMDLVEYSYFENYDSPAFLCSKLVYKSLAYIFRNMTPTIASRAIGLVSSYYFRTLADHFCRTIDWSFEPVKIRSNN